MSEIPLAEIFLLTLCCGMIMFFGMIKSTRCLSWGRAAPVRMETVLIRLAGAQTQPPSDLQAPDDVTLLLPSDLATDLIDHAAVSS